jgi:hypothetical protein
MSYRIQLVAPITLTRRLALLSIATGLPDVFSNFSVSTLFSGSTLLPEVTKNKKTTHAIGMPKKKKMDLHPLKHKYLIQSPIYAMFGLVSSWMGVMPRPEPKTLVPD